MAMWFKRRKNLRLFVRKDTETGRRTLGIRYPDGSTIVLAQDPEEKTA